ncbi:MAG: glucose 1-dehydrogenase [Anaerolineae bacterium]|nr:glucose 1-dehydrogenase [Anaerolineae bacterium]
MPAPVSGRHQGKIAIVTGAGQGIGRGVAKRLTQEGAHVVVAEYVEQNAREAAEELSSVGPEALAYPIDIGDVAQIEKMISDVVDKFGRIDMLVNNAGVNKTTWMLDVTPDDWDFVARVNQKGVFFAIQRVARQMIAQIPQEVIDSGRAPHSYGKIVNFSSVAGRSGRPYSAEYSASKWAVISMTQSAALALAPYNINVNAVCPGLVHTPMWDYIDATQAERFGMKSGEWMASSIEKIPLKRAALPEDIAAAVSFLCSEDSDYITGQALNVDGGIEMN